MNAPESIEPVLYSLNDNISVLLENGFTIHVLPALTEFKPLTVRPQVIFLPPGTDVWAASSVALLVDLSVEGSFGQAVARMANVVRVRVAKAAEG